MPRAGRDSRDLRSPVNTGSLGSCKTCRKVKGSGGHSAGGPVLQSPAHVHAAPAGVWMDQSCPRLHPPPTTGLGPALNWEEEHLPDKEGAGCKPTFTPRLPSPSQSLQRYWGHSSGPDHQPEPCPLPPGPQPTRRALKLQREEPRPWPWSGWDHVCVPSAFPEHARGSPAGPLRTQPPGATRVIPSDFVFSAGSCEHQATEPRLH